MNPADLLTNEMASDIDAAPVINVESAPPAQADADIAGTDIADVFASLAMEVPPEPADPGLTTVEAPELVAELARQTGEPIPEDSPQPGTDEPAANDEAFDGDVAALLADPEPEDEEVPQEGAPEWHLSKAQAAAIQANPELRSLGQHLLSEQQSAMEAVRLEREQWQDEAAQQNAQHAQMQKILSAIRTPNGMAEFMRDAIDQPHGPDVVHAAFQAAFVDANGQMSEGAEDTLIEVGLANRDVLDRVMKRLDEFKTNPREAEIWHQRRDLMAQKRQLALDKAMHQSQVTTTSLAKTATQVRRMAKDAGLYDSTTNLILHRLRADAKAFHNPDTGAIEIPDDHLKQIIAEQVADQERYVREMKREAAQQAAEKAQRATRRKVERSRTTSQRLVPRSPTGGRTTAVPRSNAPDPVDDLEGFVSFEAHRQLT